MYIFCFTGNVKVSFSIVSYLVIARSHKITGLSSSFLSFVASLSSTSLLVLLFFSHLFVRGKSMSSFIHEEQFSDFFGCLPPPNSIPAKCHPPLISRLITVNSQTDFCLTQILSFWKTFKKIVLSGKLYVNLQLVEQRF